MKKQSGLQKCKLLLESKPSGIKYIIYVIVFFLFLFSTLSNAQNIGINKSGAKPSSAAVLDLNTGNAGLNLGFLPPRISLSATNTASPVTTPDTGLIVYNTATAGTSPYNIIPGYYYWTGSGWNLLTSSSTAGAGVKNYLARWTSSTNLGTGLITDNDTDVGIGTAPNISAKLLVYQADSNNACIVGVNSKTTGSNFGFGVIGLTAQSGGYGMYGINTTSAGTAMVGQNQAANGTDIGTGILGQTGQSHGYGVEGSNANSAGIGVFGSNTASSGTDTGIGVYGNSNQSKGYGVIGFNSNGVGVKGISSAESPNGIGVLGINTFPYLTDSGSGVVGQTNANRGYGVEGENAAYDGIAVYGFSTAPAYLGDATGVYGKSNQYFGYGVIGDNPKNVGVWGASDTVSGLGVYGTNQYGVGIKGTSSGGSSDGIGVLGVNLYSNAFADGGVGVLGRVNATWGYGVKGENAALDGVGIYGLSTAAPYIGDATGVFGRSSQYGGYGVIGYNPKNIGVFGESDTAAGYGIVGLNDQGIGIKGSTSAPMIGVAGVLGIDDEFSGTDSGSGVIGETYQSNGYGVMAINTNPGGTAFYGVNNAASGSVGGSGVIGQTSQSNGYGVKAINTNSNGTAFFARNTASNGGNNGIGVWGESSQSNGCGVVGFDSIGTGVLGEVVNINSTAGFFENNSSGVYDQFAVSSFGQISNGTKSTVVPDADNKQKLMFCAEAPEVLFEDYGSATLVNGKVHINLDSVYAMNVAINEKHPLRVLIKLEGDCKGLYVTNKTSTGFDVIELQGGNSKVKFTYEVIANRVNKALADGTVATYSDMRFPDAPVPPKAVIISSSPAQQANVVIPTYTNNIKSVKRK